MREQYIIMMVNACMVTKHCVFAVRAVVVAQAIPGYSKMMRGSRFWVPLRIMCFETTTIRQFDNRDHDRHDKGAITIVPMKQAIDRIGRSSTAIHLLTSNIFTSKTAFHTPYQHDRPCSSKSIDKHVERARCW
jgi:hypothetical protein